jgi:exocyst complex component 1
MLYTLWKSCSYSYSATPQESAITGSGFPNRTNSPTPSLTSRTLAQGDKPSTPLDVVANRRDHNTRISYFDPSNQATLDRLITDALETELDGEGEEENAQATLANVEEMIEGYEWASEDAVGRKMAKGAVDLIEARLLDELMALEKVTKTICWLNFIFIFFQGKHSLVSRI